MNTAQEIFDKTVELLEYQKARCIDPDTGYVTYSCKGNYSPVGAYVLATKGLPTLIQIRNDRTEPENLTSTLLQPNRDLLLALELMHDYHEPDAWHGQLHAIAKEFGLMYKGVDYGAPVCSPTMLEHTYRLEIKVRATEGQPINDDDLFNAMAVGAYGEGRPPLTEQAEYVGCQAVHKACYALVVDIGLPNNFSLVTRVGVEAYDEEDAKTLLKQHLGYPDESDLSIIAIEEIAPSVFKHLQHV